MKFWRRVSGALKDRNSIIAATLSGNQDPNLEAAIIKATSHDDKRVDYRNAQKVFGWIRISHMYIKPLIWALSKRIEKTRSWVVAIKGLMLMHGVLFLKTPSVEMMGRLPFDLSNFKDQSCSNPSTMWGYNAFIRAYFAFLDRKSTVYCMDMKEERKNINKSKLIREEETMEQNLVKVQNFQILLDMLIQVKPQTQKMRSKLVLEAMDCIIIEVFDVCSRIRNGVASALLRIYEAEKNEATMALKVLQKAITQGEQVSMYFEFCRDFGVLSASECPKVEQIPAEVIEELERIISGVSETVELQERALVVYENGATSVNEEEKSKTGLQTIITDKWEMFEEDFTVVDGGVDAGKRANNSQDLIEITSSIQPHVNGYDHEIPDLITF